MSQERDPFILPTEPKNSWQMVGWVINEPTLLGNYSKTLSKEEALFQFLKAYFTVIVPIVILLYLLITILIIATDLPSIIPTAYETDFIKEWDNHLNFLNKFILIINKLHFSFLASILAFILGFSTASNDLLYSLSKSLFVSIFASLFIGLTLDLTFLTSSLTTGLLSGLIFSLTIGLLIILKKDLIFDLVFGLVLGLTIGLMIGFKSALTSSLTYILIRYRLYLYPYYLIFSRKTLTSNPYLHNEGIFFPLPIINQKLINQAKANPSLGLKFLNFLYKYRELNYLFASKIRHASYSGFLIQRPLNAESLTLVINEELKPSDKWYELIATMKKQIISYEKETQISIKKERFDEVVRLLEQWEQQNLVESPKWNHFYFDAIDKWIEEAHKVAKNLELQQQNIEPIQKNIYRYGTPLHPNRDELIFLGREDIKQELSHKIFTNEQIPAFMIQGQRRVGKTSLINFLPELLGSRFSVVSFDCQGLESLTFGSFLSQLSSKISHKMRLKEELKFSGSWVEDWNLFEKFLNSIILEDDIKLLIVLDEYEVLHQIFEQDPKQAEFILGRIRHFLQHQNSISFIFVGLYTFSDLENPNWSDYLVHYERFKVGYLGYEDSIKLITNPTKDFRLKYTKEVADRLYHYTQGHPALIQLLCKNIVDLSNKRMDSTITMEIVETMVKEVAQDKELYPVLVFWKQLCTDRDKESIREILRGERVSDKKSLYKLEDYGFIVDGAIRVPIFEMWLERFEGIV